MPPPCLTWGTFLGNKEVQWTLHRWRNRCFGFAYNKEFSLVRDFPWRRLMRQIANKKFPDRRNNRQKAQRSAGRSQAWLERCSLAEKISLQNGRTHSPKKLGAPLSNSLQVLASFGVFLCWRKLPCLFTPTSSGIQGRFNSGIKACQIDSIWTARKGLPTPKHPLGKGEIFSGSHCNSTSPLPNPAFFSTLPFHRCRSQGHSPNKCLACETSSQTLFSNSRIQCELGWEAKKWGGDSSSSTPSGIQPKGSQ